MRLLCLTILTLAAAPAAADTPWHAYGDRFWEHWGDGQAELAAYDLVIERYGETRTGTAVTIFVTETFSNALRVKADPGRHEESDEFLVLKLNLVQDFQTGVYDYNLMTSVFTTLEKVNGRPAGSPTKISFSSQEWCGHVWHQLLFDESSIREASFSYFDGEADRQRSLRYPPDAISEDQLLSWARGLSGPDVMPGSPVELPVLRSLQQARLRHQDLEWSTVRLSVVDATHSVEVPEGTFEARTHTAAIAGGPTWTFEVEDVFPYRIVKWGNDAGLSAERRGVARMKYWRLNGEGGEEALRKIGLAPPVGGAGRED